MYDKILVHAGKELNDPRVLTDVGDVPVQEIRDCGVDDDRLMNIISDSVKAVMQQVSNSLCLSLKSFMCPYFHLCTLQSLTRIGPITQAYIWYFICFLVPFH